MRPSLLPLLPLIHLTTAYISSISLPPTIAGYEPFNITLTTTIHIQSQRDISIAFGIHSGSRLTGSLGENLITVNDIGSLKLGDNEILVRLPDTYPLSDGMYTVTAAWFGLVGTYNTPQMGSWKGSVGLVGFRVVDFCERRVRMGMDN